MTPATTSPNDQPDDQFREQFTEQGWALTDPVFSPAECDQIVADDGDRTYPALTPALRIWATDRRWAGPVATFLGPDARLFREQVVSKYPHSAGTVPWHQDSGYAPLRPPAFLTCFVALDEMAEANGCLWVLPGSHRGGPRDHVPAGPVLQVDAEIGADAHPVPMAQGSVLAFSSLTFHYSGANHSDRWRRAWIVQFCGTDTVDQRTGQPFTDHPIVAKHGTWITARSDLPSPTERSERSEEQRRCGYS